MICPSAWRGSCQKRSFEFGPSSFSSRFLADPRIWSTDAPQGRGFSLALAISVAGQRPECHVSGFWGTESSVSLGWRPLAPDRTCKTQNLKYAQCGGPKFPPLAVSLRDPRLQVAVGATALGSNDCCLPAQALRCWCATPSQTRPRTFVVAWCCKSRVVCSRCWRRSAMRNGRSLSALAAGAAALRCRRCRGR